MSKKDEYKDGDYKIVIDHEDICKRMMHDMAMMMSITEDIIDDVCDGKEMSAGVKLRELYSLMEDKIFDYHDELDDKA